MTDESSSNSEIIDKKSLVGTFKRGVASAIDSVIVLFARIFFIETIGRAWAEPSLIKFSQEFKDKFGTETPKNTPDHLDFIYNHEVFTKFMILFFLIDQIEYILVVQKWFISFSHFSHVLQNLFHVSCIKDIRK